MCIHAYNIRNNKYHLWYKWEIEQWDRSQVYGGKDFQVVLLSQWDLPHTVSCQIGRRYVIDKQDNHMTQYEAIFAFI